MQMTLFYIMMVIAYSLGSISSAVLICKLMKFPDPRTAGSGNPGATNVLRLYGKIPALLVLLGDVLKGVIPVLMIKLCGVHGLAIAIIAGMAVLGHMFPVFFGFKGGKGVATGFGAVLALSPTLGIAVLVIWIIVFSIWRYVSLASIAAAAAVPALNQFFGDANYFIALVVMALIIIVRHRQNISHLLNGTERRFGSRSNGA